MTTTDAAALLRIAHLVSPVQKPKAAKPRPSPPAARVALAAVDRRPAARSVQRAARADFSHLNGLDLSGFVGNAKEQAQPWGRFISAALGVEQIGDGRSDPAIQSSWAAAFVKAGIAPAAPRRAATLRGPTGRLIAASNRR